MASFNGRMFVAEKPVQRLFFVGTAGAMVGVSSSLCYGCAKARYKAKMPKIIKKIPNNLDDIINKRPERRLIIPPTSQMKRNVSIRDNGVL